MGARAARAFGGPKKSARLTNGYIRGKAAEYYLEEPGAARTWRARALARSGGPAKLPHSPVAR